jgi:hypothetical protein
MLDYLTRDDAVAVPVIPDTADDSLERVLCQQVWRKQEEMRIRVEQAGAEAELTQQPAQEPAAAATPVLTAAQPASVDRLPEQPAPLPTPQVMEQLY